MTERLRPSALHPQLRPVFRFVPNPPVHRPRLLRLMQAASARVRAPRRLPEGISCRFDRLGPGAGVHVFTPAGARERAGVLWIHGGGFIVGSAAQDHGRCARLARDLDVVVYSAEYRLAPGAPFPAPLDDLHGVWRHIFERAGEDDVDPARLAVAGQSAGGGLAAALVQRIHDDGGQQPAAQWLFCPMLDDRTAADRSLDGIRHYLWNNTSNVVGWSAYLGREPGGQSVPDYAVPARREDLKGLPPAWIGVGDIELFYEEDRRYAERLVDAGVPTVLEVVPGAPHAFESFLGRTPVAKAYLAAAETWLARHLQTPASER